MSIGTMALNVQRLLPGAFEGAGRTANRNVAAVGAGTVLQKSHSPLHRKTRRGRAQDARVAAQLDGLLCRLEARMRGLKQVPGLPSPDLQMKRAGFPEASDIKWIQGKFDEAKTFMRDNPGRMGTFVDFDAFWTVDREKNTLTVSLPNGIEGPPVVSFPLEAFVRYLEKAQKKAAP